MSQFQNPSDLKNKLQTGRGDPAVYSSRGDIISIKTAFAGTTPGLVVQDEHSGVNNIESAEASKVTWTIKPDWLHGVDDLWVQDFTKMLEVKVKEYN